MLGFVVTAMAVELACGNSHLTSVILSPAIADAQDFPNGQVQCAAFGTYGSSMKPVPLHNLAWCIGTSSGVCNGNIASVATVSGSGVAQCLSGQPGTATVLAGSAGHMGLPDTGFPLTVFGSAQLSCP